MAKTGYVLELFHRNAYSLDQNHCGTGYAAYLRAKAEKITEEGR